jgi:glycosyltransferase involved in cell wall biosynthesis
MNCPQIAVLIPCYNEAAAIAGVVAAFKQALATAAVYVYDNNSTDDTAMAAQRAGAIVRREARQGKGNVVRRMFADIEADIYVLVDGDGTYHAQSAAAMIEELIANNLDMVVGRRQTSDEAAMTPLHQWGNRLFTWMVGQVFGSNFNDILSGFRVFSRRLVKSFPIFSAGFEIETEITIHCLLLRLPVGEVAAPYGSRQGSASKLHAFRDGWRILRLIMNFVLLEKPRQLFGAAFLLLFAASLLMGAPLIDEWAHTGLVPRFPTAILCTGLMILAFYFLGFGYLLSMHARSRTEAKMLAYLNTRSVRPRENEQMS